MAIVVKSTKNNKMGLIAASSYIIGFVIGSGIFITPTSILNHTNSIGLSLIIWVVGGLIAILGGYCYVELGTSIRHSGADFAYICYLKWYHYYLLQLLVDFSRYPLAFSFMCVGCLLNYPALIAIEATAFGEYITAGLSALFCLDLTDSVYAKKLIGFSLVWLLSLLNCFSLKRIAAPFQVFTTGAKIISTMIIVCTGFYFLIFRGKTENIQSPMEGSTFNVGSIVLALYASLFAFDGWDVLNFGIEEIERPRRTMPWAMFAGMGIVTFIYLTMNVAYFVVLDVNSIKTSQAVAFTFAQQTLGAFSYAIPFLVGGVIVGSANSIIFAGSRYLHAAARQGQLPTFISCIHPTSDSPRAAIIVQMLLAVCMSFIGDLDTLISYVTFATWLQRSLTLTALLWIRFRHIPVHPEAIRLPIVLPFLFLLVCYALVIIPIVTTIKVAAISLGILAITFILYIIVVYRLLLHCRLIRYRPLSSIRRCLPTILHYVNVKTTIFTQIILNTMPDLSKDEMYEHPTTVPAVDTARIYPQESLTPITNDKKKF